MSKSQKIKHVVLFGVTAMVISVLVFIGMLSKKPIRESIFGRMENGYDDQRLIEYYIDELYEVFTITSGKTMHFYYHDVDLNGDGLPDKIVVVYSSLYTGTAGNKLEILQNTGSGEYCSIYDARYRIGDLPTEYELYILDESTDGFRDLELCWRDNYAIIKYDSNQGKYEQHSSFGDERM